MGQYTNSCLALDDCTFNYYHHQLWHGMVGILHFSFHCHEQVVLCKLLLSRVQNLHAFPAWGVLWHLCDVIGVEGNADTTIVNTCIVATATSDGSEQYTCATTEWETTHGKSAV